jgi:aryl-alcohol dehydrogenase-like predicted oxidoreductase
MIKGYGATLYHTYKYLSQFDFPSRKTPWFHTSPIAIGTHLGDMNEAVSNLYRKAIEFCFLNGINFVDTAINYRGMRSERDVGFVLNKLINNDCIIKREEVVISSKAGIIPGDIEANLVPQEYLNMKLIKDGIIKESDLNIVDHHRHVLSPTYFQFAIGESKKHLNLDTIDIYYIHNPEISMMVLGQERFYKELEILFCVMEEQVQNRNIKCYGLATWNAFLYEPNHSGHISLEKVAEIAKWVGGEKHHFKFIQFPFNKNIPQGNTVKNQKIKQSWLTVLDAAKELELFVTTSAPFNLGKVFSEGKSPSKLLSNVLKTNGIQAAMVGMKRMENIKENLRIISSLNTTTKSC